MSAEQRVVVLTGARQVGKTTLLRSEEPFCNWRFHTLDDFDVLRQAREAPEDLWAGTRAVVLDEVQRAPDLLLAVKRAVDRDPGLRFALSGSANLLLMNQVSESLAGRAGYLVLYPLTRGEAVQAEPPDIVARALAGDWPEERRLPGVPDVLPLLQRGMMPPLLSISPRGWVSWWEGYVATYLERDLRQLSQVSDLSDFRRLMELLALRSAQALNQSELARDAGMSQPSVHRYLNLLETSHLIQRLPAYAAGRTTRLVKAPKLCWEDSGLAAFLAGYYGEEDLRRSRELGSFFETFVHHHLRVTAELLVPRARIHYWRTRSGQEVDFVVEQGHRAIAIEVKLASRVGYGDVTSLRAFLDDHPGAAGGLVVYCGDEVRRLGEKIVAVPWPLLTG
ncbi:MAG: ATP-binding protein [Anaerolineae bacterium]